MLQAHARSNQALVEQLSTLRDQLARCEERNDILQREVADLKRSEAAVRRDRDSLRHDLQRMDTDVVRLQSDLATEKQKATGAPLQVHYC